MLVTSHASKVGSIGIRLTGEGSGVMIVALIPAICILKMAVPIMSENISFTEKDVRFVEYEEKKPTHRER